MEQIDDYIWGKINEIEYLKKVVANDSLDCVSLLKKVKIIQQELDTKLRLSVEENYPRLLEQVSAIEELDTMQVHFDQEMQLVSNCAKKLAQFYENYYNNLKEDVSSIQNLTKINRLLSDGLRCEELMREWDLTNDFLLRAEIVYELNLLFKSNEKIRQLKWLNETVYLKFNELSTKTRFSVIEQLKSALLLSDSSVVNSCLKALNLLHDKNINLVQKDINHLMDESLRELNSLFVQIDTWSSLNGNSKNNKNQSDGEKKGKLLLQIGNKLQSFLEQYQLLGLENAQSFARSVNKIITSKVSANAPYALKLLQTIYKCLLTFPESITKIIRDSFTSLKVSILSQSLSNLFAAVDEAFNNEEKKEILIAEKLNMIMKNEIQSVSWDKEFQKEMELNIGKTLRYISSKIENVIQINEETLQLSSRINKQQTINYQMLNIAYYFTSNWPEFSQNLTTILNFNIEILLNQMKSIIILILNSMFKENMTNALPVKSLSSQYMKELCNQLKVFQCHISQIDVLVESIETLPNFLNYVIEQFLVHISLIRPLTESSIDRFSKDLEYLCRVGLQPFECKSSKHLNNHLKFIDFLKVLNLFNSDFEKYEKHVRKITGLSDNFLKNTTIPCWFVIHILINLCGSEVLTPPESASWTSEDYIKWFSEHSDTDRLKFCQNLMFSYQKSVIARGGTEYVKLFPLINEIITKTLSEN